MHAARGYSSLVLLNRVPHFAHSGEFPEGLARVRRAVGRLHMLMNSRWIQKARLPARRGRGDDTAYAHPCRTARRFVRLAWR
jgi:hypothetical protein